MEGQDGKDPPFEDGSAFDARSPDDNSSTDSYQYAGLQVSGFVSKIVSGVIAGMIVSGLLTSDFATWLNTPGDLEADHTERYESYRGTLQDVQSKRTRVADRYVIQWRSRDKKSDYRAFRSKVKECVRTAKKERKVLDELIASLRSTLMTNDWIPGRSKLAHYEHVFRDEHRPNAVYRIELCETLLSDISDWVDAEMTDRKREAEEARESRVIKVDVLPPEVPDEDGSSGTAKLQERLEEEITCAEINDRAPNGIESAKPYSHQMLPSRTAETSDTLCYREHPGRSAAAR